MKIDMTKKTVKLAFIALFIALITVGAYIQIPLGNMDYFTLQFFFIILAGIFLGPLYGTICVAIYVAMGLLGLPVFAGGGGIMYVMKPSFGYLAGFIFTAFTAGILTRKMKNPKFWKYILIALAGMLVTYIIGLPYKYLILKYYLQDPLPFKLILLSCFPIDMPCDIILSVLAGLVSVRLNKIVVRK